MIDVKDSPRLSDADSAFEHPESTVIVAIGFAAEELRGLIERARNRQVELVVSSDDASVPSHTPPFQTGQINVTPDDPTPLLRKAILRLHASRIARTEELPFARLEEYFALRYRVWVDLGYLSLEDRVDKQREWELNYSDLTAMPICMCSTKDNRLIGCARLVREKGTESRYAQKIRELVRCSPSLRRIVDNVGYDHPFDMFEPFPKFSNYYRPLVKKGIAKAEVSRVIIDPAFQSHGLGELLVDQLVTFARQLGIQRLFLACKPTHERFYGRCGFSKIPDLNTDRFGGGIDVTAIAMDLDLQ